MESFKFQSILKVESLAAILVLVTIVSVIAFHCFERELNITAGSTNWKSHVADDRSVGGNSFTENLSTESKFKFAYETQGTDQEAYAIFLVMPEDTRSTIDLSWFQNITLTARVESNQPQDFLLILRDKVDHLFSEDDSSSMKYNESFFELTSSPKTITISKDSFNVSRWWAIKKATAPADFAPTFDNFRWIELAVCNAYEANSGTVIIDSIKFTGPIFTPVNFYRGLFGIWSVLALPLCTQFYLNAKKRRNFNKSRRAHEAEISGDAKKVRRKTKDDGSDTEEIESIDVLTGLPNCFGIRDEIDHAIKAVRNGNECANVILFDVDDLKLLNKTQGVDAGDKLLQKIAVIAKAALPPKHSIARWRSDKFLILCVGQLRESSKDLACEIRKQIEAQTSSTCSFGVHQLNPINHFDEVMERVSKCVVEAKFKGKNKVVLFNFRVPKMASRVSDEPESLVASQDSSADATLI